MTEKNEKLKNNDSQDEEGELFMDENCLMELLNACCCKCDLRDDDKTCCMGLYVIKEHGYCQRFKVKGDKNNG
jgi:hypothetical protein